MFINHQEGILGRHILSPQELDHVLDRFTDPPIFFVRGHLDPEYADVVDAGYAWCGDSQYRDWFYRTARDMKADGTITWVAGVANPGFNDTGVWGWGNGPRITDRRGTLEYQDHWNEVLSNQPDAVQIVTWNDFEEGTTIEPSEEYGFTFIDLTEHFAEKYSGHPANTGDNQWPWRIYRLRKSIKTLSDSDAQAQWNKKVDVLVQELLHERNTGLEQSIDEMETELPIEQIRGDVS
jgi:hypothetical protein